MLRELREPIPSGCLTQLQLDEWRAGELQERGAAAVVEHLQECSECQARLEAIDARAEAFLRKYPPDACLPNGVATEKAVLLRPRRQRAAMQRWAWASASAVVAAAAGYLVLPRVDLGNPPTIATSASQGAGRSSDATRAKGTWALGFFVKRGAEVLLGGDSMALFPRDQLRFFVRAPRPSHLAILSRDASSAVTEYFPGSGRSQAVEGGARVLLESSVELDETLGREALWAIFCEQPFDVSSWAHTLEERGRLTPKPGCTVESLEIQKVPL